MFGRPGGPLGDPGVPWRNSARVKRRESIRVELACYGERAAQRLPARDQPDDVQARLEPGDIECGVVRPRTRNAFGDDGDFAAQHVVYRPPDGGRLFQRVPELDAGGRRVRPRWVEDEPNPGVRGASVAPAASDSVNRSSSAEPM